MKDELFDYIIFDFLNFDNCLNYSNTQNIWFILVKLEIYRILKFFEIVKFAKCLEFSKIKFLEFFKL